MDRPDLLVWFGRQKREDVMCCFAFLHFADGGPARPDAGEEGQMNREHPFLFAQLQSSNDGTIVIGSGGRGSCELCHLNSPRGLAINQGYSTPGRRSLA